MTPEQFAVLKSIDVSLGCIAWCFAALIAGKLFVRIFLRDR